jgi:hypothetical protein
MDGHPLAFLNLHPSADDRGIENNISVHDALLFAADDVFSLPEPLAKNEHAARRGNLSTEPALLDPAKAHESGPANVSFCVKGGELGGALDHEYARKERPAGNMAGNPEFVAANIFVTNQAVGFFVGIDNAIEHFHVAALRIELANDLLVVEDLGYINPGNVE